MRSFLRLRQAECFGTVKIVPYRVFYNAWQALKCAVGRGALPTPQPCPAAHYKICDNPHTGPCRIFCIIIHHKLPHEHPPTKYKKSPARQAVTMARPCRGFLDFILGNTAQFPPYGLSTAPAAAARHLRCQNAR